MSRTSTPFRVAIIGSGFGGIAAAVKLRKRSDAEFVIYEKAGGLGGTWFENRYPGCEVDIPSHAYSFSFLKYDWPRTHATQPELLAYAEHVVDRFALRQHIRLNVAVQEVRWNAARRRYTVTASDDSAEEYDAVVSSVGLLSVPRLPDWPGLDNYEGIRFHTSLWEHEHDLTGKRIAVVGTGSTAAQVVPTLAPIVGDLTVFQREPGWVEPKSEREFTPRERWIYRNIPLAQRLHRYWIFWVAMRRFRANDTTSRRQVVMRQLCEDFINRTVHDPETRAALTPTYPWGCKRPVVASTYYPAFNRPNVHLVPKAVERATRTGLVDADGVERDFDAIVMSTGFQPTRFLNGLEVRGRDGVRLHDVWHERASAYLGVTVPGFPNFFVLYGPNTNGGTSIIAQLERQAEVAAASVRRLERTRDRVIDTDPGAAVWWVRWIDRQLDAHASAMNAGCHNYFHAENGANVTQWPRTQFVYFLVTRLWRRRGLRFVAD